MSAVESSPATGPLVLTIGETMALLDPHEDGPLRYGSSFRLRIGGAESNVAATLARLGVPVAWISVLGEDILGDVVVEALAAQGVDLHLVRRVATASTGVFLKERVGGSSTMHYVRRGSAATQLAVSDLPSPLPPSIRLLHVTGITCAVSESARALVLEAVRRADAAGVATTFDLNYRTALWESPAAAAAVYRAVLPHAAWCLCGLEEARAVFDVATGEEAVAAIQDAGARAAVVRVGRDGVCVTTAAGVVRVPAARSERVVDDIGAGDAFAAGFGWGLLAGWPAEACARAGQVLAAHALRGSGDWETAPRLSEVGRELHACRGALESV